MSPGVPKGALLSASDNPMTPANDITVSETFVEKHPAIGIDALIDLRDSGESVKHLRFE